MALDNRLDFFVTASSSATGFEFGAIDGEEPTQQKLKSEHNDFVDAVHRLEPELRHLAGVLATLRIFGEAGDSIDPHHSQPWRDRWRARWRN